jgi:DNA-binding NtrC family response regulator
VGGRQANTESGRDIPGNFPGRIRLAFASGWGHDLRMASDPLSGFNILVVDDEPLLRRHLGATLESMGADVSLADSLRAARQLAADLSFDFVLLDVNLPDGTGTDLLRDGVFGSTAGVIVMTAVGGVAGAVAAMKLGALDYLTKPFEPESLVLTLARARQQRQAVRAAEHRKAEAPEAGFFFGATLAGLENQLQRILTADQRLHAAGSTPPPVLIQGETGTGKTTIARWIHTRGPRSAAPLVEANCAAIPENLAESELFGHEKGAFTDARSARMGLFEAASGGTLFLDELASLSLALQAKLLTVLEDRKVRRVGGNRDIPVDVRVITAANRDLRELVREGRFREDLYHRLDLFRVVLVPLRERGEDILQLTEALISRVARRHRLPVRGVSELGRRRLLGYGWPGNVRELSHELERALVFEDGDTLNLDQLIGTGGKLAGKSPEPSPATEPWQPGGDWFNAGYQFPETGFSLEEAILRLIELALAQTKGNVSRAARKLGVSRDYLRYRLGGWKDGPKSGGVSLEGGLGESPQKED